MARKLCRDSKSVSCQWRAKKLAKDGFVSGFGKKGRANHSFQSDWPCNSDDILSKNSFNLSGFLFCTQLMTYSFRTPASNLLIVPAWLGSRRRNSLEFRWCHNSRRPCRSWFEISAKIWSTTLKKISVFNSFVRERRRKKILLTCQSVNLFLFHTWCHYQRPWVCWQSHGKEDIHESNHPKIDRMTFR